MGHDQIGPRERQLRELREARFAENAKKVTVADLREKAAAVKVKPKKTKKRKGR